MSSIKKLEEAAMGGTLLPTSVPWEKCVLHNKLAICQTELAICQTIVCVEAIKFLEAEFSTVLKSQAAMREYRSITLRLTPLVRQAAEELHHQIPKGETWSGTVSFGVFGFVLAKLLDAPDECDAKDVKFLPDMAKPLFMAVLNEGLQALKEKCLDDRIEIDLPTQKYMEEMQEERNFTRTVFEWSNVAGKRQEINQFSHPWLLLSAATKKVMLKDLERNLEDDFSKDFPGVGYLGRLALRSKIASEESKVVLKKEHANKKYVELVQSAANVDLDELLLEYSERDITDLQKSQFDPIVGLAD